MGGVEQGLWRSWEVFKDVVGGMSKVCEVFGGCRGGVRQALQGCEGCT